MLQTTTNIDVDFYDKNYILINAKQLDRSSRFLFVTCYNHGEPYSLNNGEHAAYVRYRKADDYGVFNNCDINHTGKITVELTEQMLAADGICYADLIIVNKGDAVVDPNTGEINEIIDNASVLSTMTFCIDVNEVPVLNSDIESTYEFTLLNDNLGKYWADFEDVMKTSKSWAIGDTGIRDGENTNNSKYWANQSKTSENKAKSSETNALNSANRAQSYAVGGTGTRGGEDADNAHYYYERIRMMVDGLSNGFIPMGTVSFSELATVEKATGYIYNISDDFVTDNTFREGQGKSYTAGTNVYYTASGLWDAFGGAVSPTATVSEVKDYLGI